MKKLLVLIIALSISCQSFADCRSKIEENLIDLKSENSQTNQNLGVGVGLGTMLIFVSAPLGLTVVGIVGVGSGVHEIRKKNLKRLKKAIDEAYNFFETNESGERLDKLLKKVNRKLDHDISMDELVGSIIASNENEDMCNARSINSFAKKISVTID